MQTLKVLALFAIGYPIALTADILQEVILPSLDDVVDLIEEEIYRAA